jgi:pantoate--beta-alanine ligase
MIRIPSPAEMQRLALDARRAGRRIGLVPTMGCLHEGHASLIRMARPQCDFLVVSVFVNPTQFGPHEDFARYPRTLEADARLCEREGADGLFCPATAEMYAPDHSVFVDETSLSDGLCGRSRPGHFRGVATVVAKLFNIVLPDVAVFGQKDAQQVRVIEQLVRDLNFAVRIVVAPTVREPDGLAMSSRNVYLSPDERTRAADISRVIRAVQARFAAGERDAAQLRAIVEDGLREGAPPVAIDYVEIVDYATLKPVGTVEREALLAVAVRVGATRLIDNVRLGSPWAREEHPRVSAGPFAHDPH